MQEQNLDRADFLKLLGAGAGVAGLAALAGAQASSAGGKAKYVFAVTHGSDDPDRAVLALLLAQVVLKKGLGAVQVWMTLGGAELAHKDKAPKISSPIFSKLGEPMSLMRDIKERGGSFRVCPPCAEHAGATGAAKLDFFELAGGDWLVENIVGANAVWF